MSIIPPDRLPISGFWKNHAGVSGGINTSGWTVTPIVGLDTTGGFSADNFSIINAAITAASPKTILTIETGVFAITGRISLNKNFVVLRGASDASTISLNNYANINTGACTVFRISGTVGSNAGVYAGISSTWRVPAPITGMTGYSLTSGILADAGTTGLFVLSSFITGFQLNKMARIFQQNNSGVPIVSVDADNNLQGQIVMIRSTGAYMIGFEPPLGFALYPGLTPKMECNINVVSGVGIENIFFDGTHQARQHYHVQFNRSYKSWITGCQFFNAVQYMHYWNGALQCEARHNTTWLTRDANLTTNHGPNMAGHKLDSCCSCLVIDSIYYRQFPSIQINGSSAFVNISSHGNVVAYNFSTQAYNSNNDAAQDYESSHGPHCQYDLYEGNIGDKFSMDAYYGSASNVTVLRSWFGGANPYSTTNNIAVNLNRFTRDYNIVGNILGKSGYNANYINTSGSVSSSVYRIYRMGYPNTDNSNFNGPVQPSSGTYWADWGTAAGAAGFQELDLDVEDTTLFRGNYIVGSGENQPSGENLEGAIIVNSYLYDTVPSWWPSSLAWPPFDPLTPNAVTGANPAGYRYLYGVEPPNSGYNPTIIYVFKRLGSRIKFKGLAIR